MPKIKLLITSELGQEGEILEKTDGWISFRFREQGEKWDIYTGKENEIKIAQPDESASVAYDKLSDAEKESVRKGYKRLALRKNGWVLRDCISESSEEINITLNEQTKIKKDGAISKAETELRILGQIKVILKKVLIGEDVNVVCEDSEMAYSLVDRLSLGTSEVDALRAEIERLNRIIKTKYVKKSKVL